MHIHPWCLGAWVLGLGMVPRWLIPSSIPALGLGSACTDVEIADPSQNKTDKPHKEDKNLREYALANQSFWLLLWMANNIGVTMINKSVFARADFKYPFALSTIHMACNVIGAQLFFLYSRNLKPKQVDGVNRVSILSFSILFALNIAIGNVSLRYVSVNFNQVFRSLVPAVVMIMSMIYFTKTYSTPRIQSVFPIMVGVALSVYGEMTFSWIGLFFTILCVILAALKVVVSGELLTGDMKLHPVDLLSKMCPLAMLEVGLISVCTGEVKQILNNWDTLVESGAFQVVLISGIVSFSLNLLSFQANRLTSPLTLTIAANVKQVMLILLGTMYFGTPVTYMNGIGITVTLMGSAWYSFLSATEGKS